MLWLSSRSRWSIAAFVSPPVPVAGRYRAAARKTEDVWARRPSVKAIVPPTRPGRKADFEQ